MDQIIQEENFEKLNDKPIWDMDFGSSTDSEDNDSEEEEKELNRKQFDELMKSELKYIKNLKLGTV